MKLAAEVQADIIATAAELAEVARSATLSSFRAENLLAETTEATRFDPVTAADRLSETRMREVLARRRPRDGILGEEFGAVVGSSGLTWVLDPIDGTRGFMSGTPTWGVLISIRDATGPLYGLIDQPYIKERFEGGFGRSEVNGPMGRKLLRTRPARPLTEATLFTTFPEVGTAEDRLRFDKVAQKVRLLRYGCDCYAYALIAAGQIDLVIEAGLQAYDIQAPIAVIEAAGGIVTDWQGRPCPDGGRVLAAANAEIHAEALALLNR